MSILKSKNCLWCHQEFIPKKRNALNCSNKCSSYYSSWKSRTLKKYGVLNKREEVSRNQFLEVHNYLQDMKTKNFIADLVDIYKLVHFYDVAFPHLENLPKPGAPERSLPIMFYKLAVWYRNKKSRYNL